ncbi:MAG: hypothetical protein ACYSTI_12705 [Planctomycetota bacterium]
MMLQIGASTTDPSYEWRKRIAKAQEIEREFYNYLVGNPKFQGPCEDYISIHEVLAYLDRIGQALNGVED